MAQQYKIWHQVETDAYKSDKSFGSNNEGKITIFIGTSKRYSYKHIKIVTTREEITDPKYGECYLFKTTIDNLLLKESLFKKKEKKLIYQKTYF